MPTIAIFTIDLKKDTVFYPSVFKVVTVIIALIIFVYALLSIKNTVKGIERAYTNQVYMKWHFFLLITTMIFNIASLFYYINNKVPLDEKTVDELKIYFSFKVVFIFWDLNELAV